MIRNVRRNMSVNPYKRYDEEAKKRVADEEAKKKKRQQQQQEDLEDLGPGFVPLVDGDGLQKKVLSDAADQTVKEDFLESLSLRCDRHNLLRLLNFIDDPDWKVRFQVAKGLRTYLFQASEHTFHEIISALNHLENDDDSAVRLHVIETYRNYRLHRSRQSRLTSSI